MTTNPTAAPETIRQFIGKLRLLRIMLAVAYDQWRTEVWPKDIDGPACCDGRECGCGAMTVREAWEYRP